MKFQMEITEPIPMSVACLLCCMALTAAPGQAQGLVGAGTGLVSRAWLHRAPC